MKENTKRRKLYLANVFRFHFITHDTLIQMFPLCPISIDSLID